MPNYVTNLVSIYATDEEFTQLLAAIRRDGDVLGSFDFNKLIPMPNSLDVTHGSITNAAISAFLSHLKNELYQDPSHPGLFAAVRRYEEAGIQAMSNFFLPPQPLNMTKEDIEKAADQHEMTVPDFLALGKQYLDNQLQYGAHTWYDWRVRNWGTKWALEQGSVLGEDAHTLAFDTAWSPPSPIITALSRKFPTLRMEHSWADEDLGHNVGQDIYLGGKVIDAYLPEAGSPAAYELAFEIKGLTPEDCSLRFDIKSGAYVYDEGLEQQSHPALSDQIEAATEKRETQSSHATILDHPAKNNKPAPEPEH